MIRTAHCHCGDYGIPGRYFFNLLYIKNMIRQLRFLMHITFLNWAFKICPEGITKLELAKFLVEHYKKCEE